MKTTINVQISPITDQIKSLAREQVKQLIYLLSDKSILVGFAESCTGGLMSSLVTEHAGVSDFFWGSVVSYSNDSKSLFLNVQDEVFANHGAVSAECAAQMAEGLVKQIKKTTTKDVIALSVTGIAGPTGGSAHKPVGTVFIAVAGTQIATQIFHHEFVGTNSTITREHIQYATVFEAARYVCNKIKI